jgi:hypothetical protein
LHTELGAQNGVSSSSPAVPASRVGFAADGDEAGPAPSLMRSKILLKGSNEGALPGILKSLAEQVSAVGAQQEIGSYRRCDSHHTHARHASLPRQPGLIFLFAQRSVCAHGRRHRPTTPWPDRYRHKNKVPRIHAHTRTHLHTYAHTHARAHTHTYNRNRTHPPPPGL